jgi:branched-chain amino acid transport system substrate-binding protein
MAVTTQLMSDQRVASTQTLRLSRRMLLRTAAVAAAIGTGMAPRPGRAQSRTLKVGYVSPETGALAGFGEADRFVFDALRSTLQNGITNAGRTYPVDVQVRDSQSDPNRAAQVASDLILSDNIDLMIVGSTPETTNPVSDQCEANGVPCISSVAPWQPWFFGRNGDPTQGFQWTYHFFWGLEDVIGTYLDMWSQVDTNKKVGGLFPNDGDGNAWGDAKLGFPGPLAQKGFTLLDPGRYQDLTDDFSAQISRFKADGDGIVTGVPIPPDFTTFWKQAAQQGFRPRIASIGKALLFPSSIEALGDIADGLSTEVWWTPNHPYTSSLTGQSAGDLAAAYTTQTGKQWTQPIGFVHALAEVALDALTRAADLTDKSAIVAAIKATQLNTIVGPIDWSKGPMPNVAKTPLVGGQWGKGSAFPFELTVVSNVLAPTIPVGGKLRPLPGSSA